ncbi:MAG: murein biosynthesis integral membrane protein MurJ [Janthinobacterium lividum]
MPSTESTPAPNRSRWSFLHPAGGHTVASATVLLMLSSVLSGVLALVRIKYVNYLFGAGVAQDAYRAAFKLPDLLNYFLIGGAASISLITVLNRYLEAGDDEGADRALSVILCTMLVVLGAGVLLAEIFAPQFVWLAYKGFRGDIRANLCTSLTRLLLPAQLFFFIGSVMTARLQVRKIFAYQALTPLIYNGGIIAGAVLLHRQLGIFSLAVGVLGGVILGSALLNSVGALRTGMRLHPRVSFQDPAFREWLRLSLPLMIGVSLVMFDGVFLNYFASVHVGGVTLINNAKDLFNAPFSVIGPAVGAASLPFFASLFQSGRSSDFSAFVGRSVSRLFSVGLLVSAWMIALAPWLMDLFRGGRFNRADAQRTTQLFAILAVTLALWAVQGIYARAFYAASDTRTPAITGTVITVVSVPFYWLLFRAQGLQGLAIASDLGITAQTITLAILLHRKRLVSLAHLEGWEIGRAGVAALVAVMAAGFVALRMPTAHTHPQDVVIIAAGTLVWAAVSLGVLHITGSKLPAQLRRRKATA